MICIKDDRAVLDEASVKFTRNLYMNLMSGQSVCHAFEEALKCTKVVIGPEQQHESEPFVLIKGAEHSKDCSLRIMEPC